MSHNLWTLLSRARSFQEAMVNLPKKELALEITGEYATEYNRLRDKVRSARSAPRPNYPQGDSNPCCRHEKPVS